MKQFATLGAMLLLCIGLSAQSTTAHSLYFDFDRHELTAQSRQALDRLAADLQNLPDFEVEIEANTDDRGDQRYNEDLAARRAQSVIDFFAARGISARRTEVHNYGETRPAYANTDEAGRQRNRRVDINVTSWTYGSIDDLFGRLKESGAQQFSIDPQRSTRLVGSRGSSIWIPAGSLVFADGSLPSEPVTITLKEAYRFDEMISQGLHTSSGGKLLETGGMIFLQAESGGQALQVATGQNLVVGMPSPSLQEGMQLFQGSLDAEGRLSDWQPSGQSFSAQLETALFNLSEPPPAPELAFFPPHYRLDLSGKPRVPVKPTAPPVPHEPRRESFRYRPGFVKTLFMGTQKIKAIEEARFERAKAEYVFKVERYEQQLVRHQEELGKYAEKYAAYQEALKSWNEGLKKQRESWRERPAYQKSLALARAKYEQQMEIWKKGMERWEAIRAEKLKSLETSYDEKGQIDAASLQNYFFKVNTLGWINCDRFHNIPEEEKEVLVIADTDQEEERIFIVFESINSMTQPMKTSSGNYTMGSLPKSANVKVISIKLEDGRPQLAVQRLQVSEAAGRPLSLEYRPCRLSEIREALASL